MGCANGASENTWSCVKQDVLTTETSRFFRPDRPQRAKTDASHPSLPFPSRSGQSVPDCQRHCKRHCSRGSGEGVRGVPPGGDGGEEGRRHGLGLTLCRKFVELAAWRDGSISI